MTGTLYLIAETFSHETTPFATGGKLMEKGLNSLVSPELVWSKPIKRLECCGIPDRQLLTAKRQ